MKKNFWKNLVFITMEYIVSESQLKTIVESNRDYPPSFRRRMSIIDGKISDYIEHAQEFLKDRPYESKYDYVSDVISMVTDRFLSEYGDKDNWWYMNDAMVQVYIEDQYGDWIFA